MTKTRAFDAATYLDTEEDIAEYLCQVLADNDPVELAAALGDIARARGMSKLFSPGIGWIGAILKSKRDVCSPDGVPP